MASLEQAVAATDDFNDVDAEIKRLGTEEISSRARLIENETRVLKSDYHRLTHEQNMMMAKIKDNTDKININKQLPYLVSNVVEILDIDPEGEEEEDGANVDLDSQRKGKCAVIRTSMRQTVFLPIIGLVPTNELTAGDLIGVHKDSFLILEKLPAEYDSRVKVMEVEEKPTETYSDIGGLDKQVEELVEAI
ncbi:26S proteasome regulatory subunit 6A, partial [Coemansia erecta]